MATNNFSISGAEYTNGVFRVYDVLREIQVNACVDCAEWLYPLINGESGEAQ